MLAEWYRHSASSGNKWINGPDVFLWTYGFGIRSETNESFAMGNASEQATYEALIQEMDDETASKRAVELFDEEVGGVVCKQRDGVGEITKNFLSVLRPLGKPLTFQADRKTELGLKYPVKTVTDFGYEDCIIDTKATLRWPPYGKPRAAHLRQQALYEKVYEKPAKLLYATPKKVELMEIDDQESHLQSLMTAFRAIEGFEKLYSTPEDATKGIPFNPDNFAWSGLDIDDAKKKWST